MSKRARGDDGGSQSTRGRGGKYPWWQAKAAGDYRRYLATKFPQGSEGSLNLYGADWKSANDHQKMARQAFRYKGPGDYKKWLKWGSRIAGAGVGALLGGPSGAVKGWNAGGAISRNRGWGDYNAMTGADGIRRNQIFGRGADQHRISVNKSDASGDIILEKSEFVRNVIVPGRADATSDPLPSYFDVQSLPINPGQEEVFPFLSNIASNFEMYELNGLIFQYKPLSSESANSTNALGKVIMATNYDPSAEPFVSSHHMENYDYSNSAVPSAGQHHGVETAPGQRLTKQLYIRMASSPPGPAPAGQKDKLLTDLGLFQLATEGIPVGTAPQMIGELWVTYRVKLSRSTISRSLNLREAEFNVTQVSAALNGSGVPTFSAPATQPTGSTLDIYSLTFPSGTRFDIELPLVKQSGTYLVQIRTDTTLQHLGNWSLYLRNCRLVCPWKNPVYEDHVAAWVGVATQASNTVVQLYEPTGLQGLMSFYINMDAPEQDESIRVALGLDVASFGGTSATGTCEVSISQVATAKAEVEPTFQ